MVYQGLADEVREDYANLKRCMLEAFSADLYDAYEQLRNRQMRIDESADVYLADVKRLAKIVDPEISYQFISSRTSRICKEAA